MCSPCNTEQLLTWYHISMFLYCSSRDHFLKCIKKYHRYKDAKKCPMFYEPIPPFLLFYFQLGATHKVALRICRSETILAKIPRVTLFQPHPP